MVGILIYRAQQSDENLIELKTTQFDSLYDSTTETEDWFDNATISDYPTYPTEAVSSSAGNIIYVSEPTYKVIHTKYSKHRPSTVAHTFECVCSKINHGLNHGLFISLLKLINCPIH